MRQILFKAKLKNKNKWVEGFYCCKRDTTYCFAEDYERHPVETHHYIIQDQMTDWGLPNELKMYEIDFSTLCQFTGLTDKTGKKIFENDIIKVHRGRSCIVKWYSSESYCGFDLSVITTKENMQLPPPSQYSLWCKLDTEVLGNVFDNPELLEE